MSQHLVFIAIAIIIVLGIIALFLHFKLYQRNKTLLEVHKQQQADLDKDKQQRIKSIHIIAQALVSQQVDVAEGALRISKLLDELQIHGSVREPFVVFDEIRAKIEHIPFLSEWKKLSKKERSGYRQQIDQVETKYRDFAIDAADKVKTFAFD